MFGYFFASDKAIKGLFNKMCSCLCDANVNMKMLEPLNTFLLEESLTKQSYTKGSDKLIVGARELVSLF